MPSRKNVQNTHIGRQLRQLHGAVLDIVAAMNRPQRDEALIREAGIPLDRALFPLLVRSSVFCCTTVLGGRSPCPVVRSVYNVRISRSHGAPPNPFRTCTKSGSGTPRATR